MSNALAHFLFFAAGIVVCALVWWLRCRRCRVQATFQALLASRACPYCGNKDLQIVALRAILTRYSDLYNQRRGHLTEFETEESMVEAAGDIEEANLPLSFDIPPKCKATSSMEVIS